MGREVYVSVLLSSFAIHREESEEAGWTYDIAMPERPAFHVCEPGVEVSMIIGNVGIRGHWLR